LKKSLTTGQGKGFIKSKGVTEFSIGFILMRKSWNGLMSLKIKMVLSEMILSVLILSFSLFFNTNLYAKERNQEMGIVLVAVGEIDKNVMEWLKNNLAKVFNREVRIGKGMPEPDYAFNQKRNQYLSTAILKAILDQKEYAHYDKILGIVDHDLYVPELNFVFGEASRKAAVISLTRLRQTFYHLPEDQNLFHQRVLTEAVHELGHTYGLGHCENPRCVMFFSNSLKDTDRKGSEFCQKCKNHLLSSY
jgi:archaemetzincin